MGRLGFVYDQTRCIGCNACQMACKDEHDLEPGLFFRRVDTIEFTDENGEHVMHYSGSCNHCEDPACVAACITHCLRFGDLEELTRDDPDRYTASLPFLPSPELTHPSLRIKHHLHDGFGDQADQ